MVSHYDCEKQHNRRQFNSLNVKQCTEAPSNIQHANVNARNMLMEQFTAQENFHTVRRSLFSTEIRKISNSFYCLPIEQNVLMHCHFYACREKLDL